MLWYFSKNHIYINGFAIFPSFSQRKVHISSIYWDQSTYNKKPKLKKHPKTIIKLKFQMICRIVKIYIITHLQFIQCLRQTSFYNVLNISVKKSWTYFRPFLDKIQLETTTVLLCCNPLSGVWNAKICCWLLQWPMAMLLENVFPFLNCFFPCYYQEIHL